MPIDPEGGTHNKPITYKSLARTENSLQVLEKFAIFGNAQPQLQPQLAKAIHGFEHQSRLGTSFSSEGIRISCAGEDGLEPTDLEFRVTAEAAAIEDASLAGTPEPLDVEETSKMGGPRQSCSEVFTFVPLTPGIFRPMPRDDLNDAIFGAIYYRFLLTSAS